MLAGDGGGTYGVEIAAVGVDDDDRSNSGPAVRTISTIIAANTSVPIEAFPRNRRARPTLRSQSRGDDGGGDSTGCRLSNRAGDDRVGVERQVRAVLLRGAKRQHEDAPPLRRVREIAEPSHRASVGGLCPGVIPSRRQAA